MENTTTDTPAADAGVAEQILPDLPSTQPVEPATESAAEQPAEPTSTPAADDSAQAGTEDDLAKFATAKGFDPANLTDNERKALQMAQNAEKLMHKSTVKASELEKAITQGDQPANSDIPTHLANDPFVQSLVERVDRLDKGYTNIATTTQVKSFFDQNPGAKEYEAKMAQIVTDRPEIGELVKAGYLSLTDLHAMAQGTPDAIDKAKADGGREALEAVATKQQARAMPGAATNNDLSPPEDDPFLAGLSM